MKNVSFTILSPLLLDLKSSMERRVPIQVRNLIDSHLCDKDVLVNAVRTQLNRTLPPRPQPSSDWTQLGDSLENTLEKLTRKPYQATVASSAKVSPTGTERTRLGEESIAKRKPICLATNPDMDEISDTPTTRDRIPTKTASGLARKNKATENLVAENLNKER